MRAGDGKQLSLEDVRYDASNRVVALEILIKLATLYYDRLY